MTTAAKWSIGVFMGIGVLLLGFGVYFVSLASASHFWDQVDGQISHSQVISRRSQSGGATNFRLEYAVTARYRYQVDGISYQNDRYSLGSGPTIEGGFNDKERAQTWLTNSSFQVGDPVTVYVKPGAPQETVISPGANWGTWIPFIIGVAFISLPLLLVRYGNPQNTPQNKL